MSLNDVGRLLILIGLAFGAVGAGLLLLGRIPMLGRLPGDLMFQRGGVTVFLPIATMILISMALTLLLNILGRLL